MRESSSFQAPGVMRIFACFHRLLGAFAALASLGLGASRADIFLLQDEGQVRGELVNRDESPRKTYVIQTANGGQVTLDADQVKEVKRQSPAESKYDQIRADFPDTVDGQWKLAEWCRESRLPKQRKVHLERILEMDPNHAAARHALGFSQIQGRWVTQEQLMTENGYVRSKLAPGKWVLPQEKELLEQRSKETKAQLDWSARLRRWHGWLDTDKAPQAEANIKAIDDPYAARALAKYLTSDRRREVRMIYVEALGRINASAGMDALVTASLADDDEEIRLACLDQVVAHHYKPAVGRYVQALKSKDNPTVNRAAVCLAQMKDLSAVGPLIDALVTTHTFRIQKGQPGQTSATFGTGPNAGSGGGFSFGGGGVEIVKQNFENRAVLQALVELTGGVSFNYDTKAWKYWYTAQKKPQSLDARRDAAPK
jgi:uncharacterized membrane protein YgcG